MLSLLCAGGMLAGFILFPWMGAAGENSTGAARLGDETTLLLVPAAAVIAGLAALWGLLAPGYSRFAGWLALLGGIVGLGYYAGYFYEGARGVSEASVFLAGLGFWGVLAANTGLIIQIVIPRRPLPEAAVSDANYLGVRGHGAYMLERAAAWLHAQPRYLAVFVGLALLTTIEVILTDIPNTTGVLVALSGIKVALVVMYYMHLKHDHWLFTAIILVPIPFAAITLLALIFGL
jgi:hypothetical protein